MVSSLTVKACPGTWHIAHDMVPLADKRRSKNNFSPSEILAPVGLSSAGNGTGGSPSGALIDGMRSLQAASGASMAAHRPILATALLFQDERLNIIEYDVRQQEVGAVNLAHPSFGIE